MIEVIGLSQRISSREVLREISFKVNNGKVYGIYGAPGSGKSTLMALLAGALPIEKGILRINGFDMEQEGEKARRCVGYLPESLFPYPELTVYEFLQFVAACKQVREDKRFLAVHQVMEKTDLTELRNTRIAALAPMDIRLLSLAQAMLGEPDILILDDPVKGLSNDDEREIKEHIREYAARGKTVFVASSSRVFLAEISNAVLLLEDGNLSAPIEPQELLRATKEQKKEEADS